MNINKKLATKVFSRLTYYNNCGLGFVAYKVYGDKMYEIFPTTKGRTTLISFYLEV